MKKVIHKAATRGTANHGWLKSYHTFSFANYQDSERMNFGMLRVLNDDIVQPKMGFGKHPHRNMEIISIPISGALSHKDNMGNKRSIDVGEVQVMSSGTGLTHSEFNDSKTDAVNFLQLWIIPEVENVTPYYTQKMFEKVGRKNQFQTLVSPKDKQVKGFR
jgi:redox-sensitive bicupin YhaK (pirin superfamily)